MKDELIYLELAYDDDNESYIRCAKTKKRVWGITSTCYYQKQDHFIVDVLNAGSEHNKELIEESGK